jgi:two-component system response regulator
MIRKEGKKILLVEDNPDDVVLTLRAFKNNNILNEILVATDGAQALDILMDKNRQLPALVLLDLKLAKVDGLEVLKKMRVDEDTRLIPVVILTSSKEDEDLKRGYMLGCNSYIRKPVDFTQFTEAVKTLGLYWLLWNEMPPMER